MISMTYSMAKKINIWFRTCLHTVYITKLDVKFHTKTKYVKLNDKNIQLHSVYTETFNMENFYHSFCDVESVIKKLNQIRGFKIKKIKLVV